MILEQITEVSNRSSNFNEIKNSINIISESKKPILKKQKKINKSKLVVKDEDLQEKIQRSTKTKSKDIPKTKKKKPIEETLEDIKEEIDELRIIYDQLETQYNTAGVDYESLFSYLSHKATTIDYGSQLDSASPMSLIISDDEAEETIQKIQISYLVGSKDNVSFQEKEKLTNWMVFNQSLRSLYEVLSPIKNKNVDYNKLN